MLLTKKEKEFLLRLLKKEKKRLFHNKQDKEMIVHLIEKFEQSSRNERVNKVRSSRL